MPGSSSSCATLAVFRLTGADRAAAGAGVRLVSCAVDAVAPTAMANRNIVINRIMCCLLSTPGRRRGRAARGRAERLKRGERLRDDRPHGSLRAKGPERFLAKPRAGCTVTPWTRREARWRGKAV